MQATPWRWKVPRQPLLSALAAGHSLAHIARAYEVNRSTVSRAVRSLTHHELASALIGRAQPSAMPDLPVVDLHAPINVMQEVLDVAHDLRAMRAWLMSDEATAALKTPARVSFVISLFDRRLNFVEAFMKTRSMLLEIVSVDRWLKEMLEILDETGTCPQCGTSLNQRKLIQRRVWQKMSPAARAGFIDPDEPEHAPASSLDAESEPA